MKLNKQKNEKKMSQKNEYNEQNLIINKVLRNMNKTMLKQIHKWKKISIKWTKQIRKSKMWIKNELIFLNAICFYVQ